MSGRGLGLSFGEEVMLRRRRRGMSIEEAAAVSGISAGAISQVENGKRPASPRAVAALVDAVAPGPEGDPLAALAAETYGRLEINLASLDRDRVDLVVKLRRVVGRLSPQAVATIRGVLSTVG